MAYISLGQRLPAYLIDGFGFRRSVLFSPKIPECVREVRESEREFVCGEGGQQLGSDSFKGRYD